jgi:hypothetical protein
MLDQASCFPHPSLPCQKSATGRKGVLAHQISAKRAVILPHYLPAQFKELGDHLEMECIPYLL